MSVGQAETIGVVFILVWFGVETLWDQLRSVVLPVWLVLPPVVLAIAYQALFGKWYIAAAMTAAIFLHLSNNMIVRAAGTVLLLAAAVEAHNVVLAVGFVAYWAMWELNIAGGADALAAYAALMFVPRPEMFWALLAGILVWAVASMIVIYRGQLVERWKKLVFRLLLRQLPTEKELELEGKPTVGGIWLGVIFFAAGSLLTTGSLRF